MTQTTNENYTLNATAREKYGTAHSRRMRRLEDQIPAIIYGGKKETRCISISHKHIIRLAKDKSILTQVLNIHDGKNQEDVLIKAVQRHPAKKQILHVDFVRVDAKKEIVVTAALSFVGEENSPGVKAGGIISHITNELEIKCLPANLPGAIEIDVSALEVNDTLHASDIKLPKGVSLAAETNEEHNPGIVSIHPKPEEEEIETAAPEAQAAAAPAGAADKDKEKDDSAS